MKKFIAIIIAGCMCLTLFGCSAAYEKIADAAEATVSDIYSEETTDNVPAEETAENASDEESDESASDEESDDYEGLTPHIAAAKEDIAKTVIMAGDPKRSSYIAENYLENPRLVNDIRGVQGYTGTYKGKEITVMAHGMGIPSMGIYAYELFHFYDVDRIIRVGSAGSISNDCKIGDLIINDVALTDSDFLDKFNLGDDYVPTSSETMYNKAIEIAEENDIPYQTGKILSSELYYDYLGDRSDYWRQKGVLAMDMEAACLYAYAAAENKEALTLVTISNDRETGEELNPLERETSFNDMIFVALEVAASQ